MADNENETPEFEDINLDEYTGARLTNAMYGEYLDEFAEDIGENASTLFAEREYPKFVEFGELYQKYIRTSLFYPQTAQITKLDQYRDFIVSVILKAYETSLKMPADSAFYIAAATLEPIVKCYPDLQNPRRAAQSNSVKYFTKALTDTGVSQAVTDAVAALGLNVWVTTLKTVNTQLGTLTRNRDIERSLRYTARGDTTTKDLRAKISEQLIEIIRICNAAYKLQPTETTRNIMHSLRGTIMRFQDMAARLDGRATSGDDEDDVGENVSEPESEPDNESEGEGANDGENDGNGEVA